jgi:hypothetical protein
VLVEDVQEFRFDDATAIVIGETHELGVFETGDRPKTAIPQVIRKYLDFKVSGPGERLLWKHFRPDRVNHLIVQRECTSVCWVPDC